MVAHREQATREAGGGLLREVLHVGIVVANLDRAVAEWERLFGARAGDVWSSDAAGVRAAFFEVGGARIELVEYTGPVVQRFGPVLARREGVHHVCFRVDDLDAALSELSARGLRVVPGFPVDGAHGRMAFLEPEPATGLITELCELGEPQARRAEMGIPRAEPPGEPKPQARRAEMGIPRAERGGGAC